MNNNFNFDKLLEKSVDLKIEYAILLEKAFNKEQASTLLFSSKLSLSERNDNYVGLLPLIENLKKMFRQIIVTENELAKMEGFSNYLEMFLVKSKTPKEKFYSFLKNVDSFIKIVNSDSPMANIDKKVKEWTILDAPFGKGYLRPGYGSFTTDKILDVVADGDPRIEKYGSKIRVIEKKGTIFKEVEYLPDKDVVEIRLNKKVDLDPEGMLIFVTLLGSALWRLDCADEGKNPDELSPYLLLYEGDKFAFKFIKCYDSEEILKTIRYGLLVRLTFALFTIDIFANDDQNYDEAFARAVNRCYLRARQKNNPFYVFGESIVSLPMEDVIKSMNFIEFYLKDTKAI